MKVVDKKASEHPSAGGTRLTLIRPCRGTVSRRSRSVLSAKERLDLASHHLRVLLGWAVRKNSRLGITAGAGSKTEGLASHGKRIDPG